jgi:hypothetical protein
MKPATMFSVPSGDGKTFTWKWRAVDSLSESEKSFEYYHDCVEDAGKHGYSIKGGTQVEGDAAAERTDLGNWHLR